MPTRPADTEYEHEVAQAMAERGYAIQPSAGGPAAYDFVAVKGNTRCAVRAKNLKGKAELAAISAFAGFMDTVEGRKFKFGIYVTPKGLTKGAALFIEENPQARLRFFIKQGGRFAQIGGASEVNLRRIGVFTFKGGVGKSKISLLLAGALAHLGKNVTLVDLNRAQNLYNLAGDEGLYLRNKTGQESVISVLRRDEWDYKKAAWKRVGAILDANFILFDFPQFFDRPAERQALGQLDLAIAPIVLTPDSLGVNHSVLRDTVFEVRRVSESVPIWFLLNRVTQAQWTSPMRDYLSGAKGIFSQAQRVHLLPPQAYHIPYHPDLELLGTDRALDPAHKLELLLSANGERQPLWLRNLLKLAQHLITEFRA